ncbi:MAG: nitronate monooxygenase [Deltaproteobacteria bacterium]|nr:nitronate monooxygenase [Deltaproteobacteria bacterium]
MQTPFTIQVGCAAPIQLAGMPGISTVELAAAVADAGGLGMLGGAMMPALALDAALGALQQITPGAVGVTFLVPFLDPEVVSVASRRSRVVDFFYGAPDAEIVRVVHAGGALAAWQVGSGDEARAAADAGCDFVIAQGTEAGGHVRGRTSLLPLLDEVLAAAALPVLAAGGLASGRDLAAVLAAGAAGARIGTRFVASAESGAHPDYVAALLAARSGDTVLCETFSVGWPDAPHRVLRSAVAALEGLPDEPVGELRIAGTPVALPRGSVFSPTRETHGRIDAMALYAGEGVGQIRDVPPAREIVAALIRDAEALLARPR